MRRNLHSAGFKVLMLILCRGYECYYARGPGTKGMLGVVDVLAKHVLIR